VHAIAQGHKKTEFIIIGIWFALFVGISREVSTAQGGAQATPTIKPGDNLKAEGIPSIPLAPLNNSGKITKPLFVVQGGNDPRVPLSEAEQMVAKVKSNKSPVWYLMANDEGHGFRKKSNADYQFYATVLFVEQHLLGKSANGL
jgi:acetyl esterase/lipase